MQKLQLSIPEPCHESWQQMTPTEQGRFCNACAKEVIDFSSMTDIQVLNYFTNLTHEKVCGRALPEQLDRTISRPEQPKKRLFWYWNYLVMFLMFFTKGNNAAAQSCTKPATELAPVKNTDVRGEVFPTSMGGVKREVSRVITGKVTDIDGNPLSFAAVKIKGTNTGFYADANGEYSVRIKTEAVLEISYAGFKSKEIATGNQNVFSTIMEKDNNQIIVVTRGASCFGATPRKAITPAQNIKGDMQVNVVGQTRIVTVNTDSLYVIDGVNAIKAKADNLNPDDISDIIRLVKSEAVALFGPDGSNGAIIITTKKLKVKNLDTVTVTGYIGTTTGRLTTTSYSSVMGGMVKGYAVKSMFTDTLKVIATKMTGAIKIYPNPVQRGNTFNIALKLKHAGFYQLQITDATGCIVLQKQINANRKDHTEKTIADSRWGSGVYYVSIIDNKMQLISKAGFIFQ